MIRRDFQQRGEDFIMKISFSCDYYLLLIATKENNKFLITIKECTKYYLYNKFPTLEEFTTKISGPIEHKLNKNIVEQELLQIGISCYLLRNESISREEYINFLNTYNKIQKRVESLDLIVRYLKGKDSSFYKFYDEKAIISYFDFKEDEISFGGPNYEDEFFGESFSLTEVLDNSFIFNELDRLNEFEIEKQKEIKEKEKKKKEQEKLSKKEQEREERTEYERLKAKYEK